MYIPTPTELYILLTAIYAVAFYIAAKTGKTIPTLLSVTFLLVVFGAIVAGPVTLFAAVVVTFRKQPAKG